MEIYEKVKIMKGIEVYRGRVVDEDEYVQGILIGEDKIF